MPPAGRQWINLADAALYTAKREGRDRWVGVADVDGLPPEQLRDDLAASGQMPRGVRLLRASAD